MIINNIPPTDFIFNGGVTKNKLLDLFNQSNNLNNEQLKFLREAEFTNGRISFISNFIVTVVPTQDLIPICGVYMFYLILFEIYRNNKFFNNLKMKKNVQPGLLLPYIPYIEKITNYELYFVRISMIIYICIY